MSSVSSLVGLVIVDAPKLGLESLEYRSSRLMVLILEKFGGATRGPDGTRAGLCKWAALGELRGDPLVYENFAGAGGFESIGRVELVRSPALE